MRVHLTWEVERVARPRNIGVGYAEKTCTARCLKNSDEGHLDDSEKPVDSFWN